MPVSIDCHYSLTANQIPGALFGTDAKWVGCPFAYWAQTPVALDAGTVPGLSYIGGGSGWCMGTGWVGNWTLWVIQRVSER